MCDAPTEQEWQLLLTELSFTELEPKALEIVTEEGEDMVAVLTDDADSYQFMPLLPDDDHPLYERLMALKNWANGFLTGFGVTDSALRPEENNLFNDLAKIGAMRIDVYDEALQGRQCWRRSWIYGATWVCAHDSCECVTRGVRKSVESCRSSQDLRSIAL